MDKVLTDIKKRWMDYLERLARINEREFGFGSLSLATFDRIRKNQY